MNSFLILFVSLWVLALLPRATAQVTGCQFWKQVRYNNVFDCPGMNFADFKKFEKVKGSSWQACATACTKLDSKGCKAFSFSGKTKTCMISFAEANTGTLKKASGYTAGYLVDSSDK
jgi:hypothetical protein